MFQKTCKTLDYMNNLFYEIPPRGGGGNTISIPWPILLCGLYNGFVVNHIERCFGGLFF